MRLSTYFIGIPAALVAAVVAIANRQSVTFSLDPFSLSQPDGNLSVRMPLFVLLLLTLFVGVLLGWSVSALSRWRKPPPALPQKPGGTKPAP